MKTVSHRLALTALASALFCLQAGSAFASSHREAPGITRSPKVDATDFYMFKSYEAGRGGFVTLIANYLPLQRSKHNDDPQQMGVIAKPAPAPPVAVTTDKFTAVVKDELKDSSDDAEAKDIDSIALVTPEDAEPVPLN